MAVILSFESVDDEPEEIEFQTLAEAIDFAVKWFVEGYEDNGLEAPKDAERIRDDLLNGREFNCRLFHERISARPRR